MSRNWIAIAAALSLAAFLPACQSSGSSGQAVTSADLCTKAKNDGAKNTAQGQAVIKSTCQPGGYTSATYWRELARQNNCVAETGRICSS